MQALIEDYGAVGFGLFWSIIEILHEEETHSLPLSEMIYKAIGKQMSTSVEQVERVVKSCLTYGLFIQDGNEFYSERVNENIETRDEISAMRSKAGKESAKKRANSTFVKQPLTHVEQNSTKKIKENESKVKEIKEKKESNFIDFWTAYPKKVGKIDAERAWSKAKDKPGIEIILKSIADHIKSEQWQKDNGQFIPNPATFINQGRWYDEINGQIKTLGKREITEEQLLKERAERMAK